MVLHLTSNMGMTLVETITETSVPLISISLVLTGASKYATSTAEDPYKRFLPYIGMAVRSSAIFYGARMVLIRLLMVLILPTWIDLLSFPTNLGAIRQLQAMREGLTGSDGKASHDTLGSGSASLKEFIEADRQCWKVFFEV